MSIAHIHCPYQDEECPYYTDEFHPCRCTLDDPLNDCDDFFTAWNYDWHFQALCDGDYWDYDWDEEE